MRDSNLFLAQMWVGKCYIGQLLDENMTLTFRIGRNMVQQTLKRGMKDGQIIFNTTLQLNTDRSALDMQRCSLTLARAGKGDSDIVGVALLSIPKQYSVPPKKLRLTQCTDKTAEIELALRIIPLQGISILSDKSSLMRDKNSSQGSKTQSQGGGNYSYYSQTSFRSILEMKDFDKKLISSPGMFQFEQKQMVNNQNLFQITSEIHSQISDGSNNYLLPPRPRSSRQRSNRLTASIHSQAIEQDRAQTLQNECECLKKLLRLQTLKNKQSALIIDKLVQTLQQCVTEATSTPQIQEQQILLEQNDEFQNRGDNQLEKRVNMYAREISQLTNHNYDIRRENINLRKENKEYSQLIVALGDYIQGHQINTLNQSSSSLETELMRKLQMAQKSIIQATRSFNTLKGDIINLEKELKSKQQDIFYYKNTMGIKNRVAAGQVQKGIKRANPLEVIKFMIDRAMTDRKTMARQLKCSRQSDQKYGEGLFSKLRVRIQKCFNSIICKKLNKDMLLGQKLDLLRGVEDCIRKFSQKIIQY